jgi:hypothetical protein
MNNELKITRISEKTLFLIKNDKAQVEVELNLNRSSGNFEISIGGVLDCNPPFNFKGLINKIEDSELILVAIKSALEYIKLNKNQINKAQLTQYNDI